MCGIAGVFRPGQGSPPEILLRRMLSLLRHRGPDEFGIYLDSSIGLAHARLSIIDLSTGQQPMCNEDGSLWIIFNGEIFNYIELRKVLVSRGHRFRTLSDTEVILHLYEEKRGGALNELNGQFAFAIWDSNRKELFLARDRMGIRPLFYARAGNDWVFGSEVKSIFAHPGVTRKLTPLPWTTSSLSGCLCRRGPPSRGFPRCLPHTPLRSTSTGRDSHDTGICRRRRTRGAATASHIMRRHCGS